MRLYALDDLVDPMTGAPLELSAGAEVVHKPGPAVSKCRNWCGRRRGHPSLASQADCDGCGNLWVNRGELTSGRSRYSITSGIPRFVDSESTIDRNTQESFGYEWEHFDRILADYDHEATNYFGIVPPDTLAGAVVLDAGCGMGRWARYVSSLGVRRLYAVDFSRAIDRAAANVPDDGVTQCVQADILRLPFRDATFDFTYCLGVLHHLVDPDAGMTSIQRVTKRDGPILLYLYYALDNRPQVYRWLLTAVTAVRQITSRLSKPAVRLFAWLVALGVYFPLTRIAWILERAGATRVALQIPLSHYRVYSLRFMAGDAFDRFATPIEKRYSRDEIKAWMVRYGRRTKFSDRTPFWVTLATTDG